MTTEIRRKLSIAFTVYNKARADARRRGDTHRIETLNKVLGNMVKAARRSAHAGRLSPVGLA
jgi:hypothetical protein